MGFRGRIAFTHRGLCAADGNEQGQGREGHHQSATQESTTGHIYLVHQGPLLSSVGVRLHAPLGPGDDAVTWRQQGVRRWERQRAGLAANQHIVVWPQPQSLATMRVPCGPRSSSAPGADPFPFAHGSLEPSHLSESTDDQSTPCSRQRERCDGSRGGPSTRLPRSGRWCGHPPPAANAAFHLRWRAVG